MYNYSWALEEVINVFDELFVKIIPRKQLQQVQRVPEPLPHSHENKPLDYDAEKEEDANENHEQCYGRGVWTLWGQNLSHYLVIESTQSFLLIEYVRIHQLYHCLFCQKFLLKRCLV